uniref:Exocyst complex component n=1 Tax=Palpitomonas bilix TaxID=652834 RepID=A0A7S3LWZ2_9EUKA|mmetsp:Transcript_8213/g.21806  ORF Transcript_8213/g.21806 Transcript_8213/m.21806 type:complete len:799 (+) Transcript_8213:140-2536(+)
MEEARIVGEAEDALLSALVESDDIHPVLRTVCERKLQQSFMRKCREFVREKDIEVEELCRVGYQDFIKSVDQLLTVKEEVSQLKSSIIDNHADLLESSSLVLDSGTSLYKARRLLQRMQSLRERIKDSLTILEMVEKGNTLLREEKYLRALRLLQSIRKNYLTPQRRSEIEFCRILYDSIPLVCENIRADVQSRLTDWMVKVREDAAKIGEEAISAMMEQRRMEEQLGESRHREFEQANEDDERNGRKLVSSSLSSKKFFQTVETHDDALEGEEGSSSITRRVFDVPYPSLLELHTCVAVHEALGRKSQFRSYYNENRRMQLQLDIQPPASGSFTQSYRAYFYRVCGFFIAEEHVQREAGGVVSNADVDALWEIALKTLKRVLRTELSDLQDPSMLLQVKDLVLLFCSTLREFGYHIAPLREYIEDSRDQYLSLLRRSFKATVGRLLEEEEYMPMTVHSREEVEAKLVPFKLDDCVREGETYPIECKFSRTVPLLCKAVKSFIFDFHSFVKSSSEACVDVTKEIDSLLQTCVDKPLNNIISQSVSLNISQAVRLAVNLSHLAQSCDVFADYISKLGDRSKSSKAPRLSTKALFLQTQNRVEDGLYELMQNKVNEFIAESDIFNTLPSSPSLEPTDAVMDLYNFLNTLCVSVLSSLAQGTREALLFHTCRCISKLLLDPLMGGSMKRFNYFFMLNLMKNVELMEDFADQRDVPNLRECFLEARQLVELIALDDLSALSSPARWEETFGQVDKMKAIMVLERYKEASVPLLKSKVVHSVRVPKKRAVEAIVKKIRELNAW